MPWTAADAKRFKKGLSPAQAKRWAATANGVLKTTGSDSRAIKIANARAGGKKKR